MSIGTVFFFYPRFIRLFSIIGGVSVDVSIYRDENLNKKTRTVKDKRRARRERISRRRRRRRRQFDHRQCRSQVAEQASASADGAAFPRASSCSGPPSRHRHRCEKLRRVRNENKTSSKREFFMCAFFLQSCFFFSPLSKIFLYHASKNSSSTLSLSHQSLREEDASRAPNAATRADKSSIASQLECFAAALAAETGLFGFFADAVTTTLPILLPL